MKLDLSTILIIVVVAGLVIALNGAIPPQPDPVSGSFRAEINQPLPLPVAGVLWLMVAMFAAWLHSKSGMRSGWIGWLISAAVVVIVIAAAYQF